MAKGFRHFRVKKGRWREVSKEEWHRALKRKGANSELFARSRKSTLRDIAKEKILQEWREKRNKGKYLWKGAAQDVLNILQDKTPREAEKLLLRRAKEVRGMAISSYYRRAAKQISQLKYKKSRRRRR